MIFNAKKAFTPIIWYNTVYATFGLSLSLKRRNIPKTLDQYLSFFSFIENSSERKIEDRTIKVEFIVRFAACNSKYAN